MSTLIGGPAERFRLSTAVDALGEAARQAGRPGLVWIAGAFYPAVGIGIGATWSAPVRWVHEGGGDEMREGLPAAGSALDFLIDAYAPLFFLPFLAVLVLPLFRLVAGLAKAGSANAWEQAAEGHRTPRLRSLW